MVLEALVAMSLTGNIVQFVHFTCSLFSKGREIYRSTSGTTSELGELRTIAEEIRRFGSNIDNALADQGGQQVRRDEVTVNPGLI